MLDKLPKFILYSLLNKLSSTEISAMRVNKLLSEKIVDIVINLLPKNNYKMRMEIIARSLSDSVIEIYIIVCNSELLQILFTLNEDHNQFLIKSILLFMRGNYCIDTIYKLFKSIKTRLDIRSYLYKYLYTSGVGIMIDLLCSITNINVDFWKPFIKKILEHDIHITFNFKCNYQNYLVYETIAEVSSDKFIYRIIRSINRSSKFRGYEVCREHADRVSQILLTGRNITK